MSPATEDTDHYRRAAAADSCNYYVAHVTNGQHNPDTIHAEILVSARAKKFLVDSGAACNILPLSKVPPYTCLQKTQKVMETCNESTLPTEALLNLRNMPRPGIGLSPVQLMMSRRTKTILPMAKSLLQPSAVPDTTTLRRQCQIKQAALHDKKARDISPLPDDTSVRIRPTELGNKQWIKGTIVRRAADRSYDVQTPDGTTVRPTRVDLRTVPLRRPPGPVVLSSQSNIMALTSSNFMGLHHLSCELYKFKYLMDYHRNCIP